MIFKIFNINYNFSCFFFGAQRKMLLKIIKVKNSMHSVICLILASSFVGQLHSYAADGKATQVQRPGDLTLPFAKAVVYITAANFDQSQCLAKDTISESSVYKLL
jgi:hypothetical protein